MWRRVRAQRQPPDMIVLAERSDDEPVLMRIVFKDGTTEATVRQLVQSFPYETLRSNPMTEEAADGGLRLLFRTEEDGAMRLDGGLLFEIIYEDDGRGPFLHLSRLNDGRAKDELPPVIREKQVMRKVVAKLEEDASFASSRIRPYGSGSF